MIDVAFRTILSDALDGLLDPTLGGALQQGEVDPSGPETRVWFGRSEQTRETYLGGGVGPTETTFSVEIASPSLDTAQDLATAVRTLHGRGFDPAGAKVWLVLVESRGDETLVPETPGEGEPVHLVTLDVSLTWQAAD